MRRPTYKSIEEAAKKSKRAAIKSSREKYLYLLSLTPKGLKRVSEKFLREEGCAICVRITIPKKNCPLKLNCRGNCVDEWTNMYSAWNCHKSGFTNDDSNYYKFITHATKIYMKLLEL